MDWSLLVLSDVIEVDDPFSWGLEFGGFPLGEVGKVILLH